MHFGFVPSLAIRCCLISVTASNYHVFHLAEFLPDIIKSAQDTSLWVWENECLFLTAAGSVQTSVDRLQILFKAILDTLGCEYSFLGEILARGKNGIDVSCNSFVARGFWGNVCKASDLGPSSEG